MAGCVIENFMQVNEYSIAYIMNVHFKSAEWGSYPWCGSVITCVVEGRSLYARVNRFLKIDGDECPGYALVDWFSEPTYTFAGGTPLVSKVKLDGAELAAEHGSVVRITQIDPCPVMVECCHDDIFFVMRDSGYDTVSD